MRAFHNLAIGKFLLTFRMPSTHSFSLLCSTCIICGIGFELLEHL